MTFVSYAQNFEDVILWRALAPFGPGFYIDVGAAEPVADSVTAAFYERGWRGINIEPMSAPFERLRAARPEDTNLQVAIEDRVGEARYFSVGRIGRDQVVDYAQRKGFGVADAERWLRPNLAYEPE